MAKADTQQAIKNNVEDSVEALSIESDILTEDVDSEAALPDVVANRNMLPSEIEAAYLQHLQNIAAQ
jgi:hypothetical protein